MDLNILFMDLNIPNNFEQYKKMYGNIQKNIFLEISKSWKSKFLAVNVWKIVRPGDGEIKNVVYPKQLVTTIVCRKKTENCGILVNLEKSWIL